MARSTFARIRSDWILSGAIGGMAQSMTRTSSDALVVTHECMIKNDRIPGCKGLLPVSCEPGTVTSIQPTTGPGACAVRPARFST